MNMTKTWENVELVNLHNRGDCIGIVRENFKIFILKAKIDDAQEEGVAQFFMETVRKKMSMIKTWEKGKLVNLHDWDRKTKERILRSLF